MKNEKENYLLRYDNREFNFRTFKRKDSKESITISKIKEYFSGHKTLTRDKFDDFLKFIELKSIWSSENDQNILWDEITRNSPNKNNISYDIALKSIGDLFIEDENGKNTSNDNFFMEDNTNEAIDKFIKSLNANHEYLYDIEFINYIFFDKDNVNQNISNINIENIILEIKTKYKFMTLNEKDIKSYLNLLNINISKELINYINSSIESILELNQISNNNYCFSTSDSNNNSRSISFSTSVNDTNSNKNTNSFNFNQNELLDKLIVYDKIIFDCMEALIYFIKNKNLINLTKKYIQNYLLVSKNNIYNSLKLINENDNKRKISESQISIANEENNSNTLNINQNLRLKPKYLSKNDMIYIKKDINVIKKENNQIVNNNVTDSNNNLEEDSDLRKSLSQPKGKNYKIKTEKHQKLIRTMKKNISYCNLNKLREFKQPFNFANNENLSRNNYFTEKKEPKTLRISKSNVGNAFFLGNNIDDNNRNELFSINNHITDHYLFESTNLENFESYDEDNDDIINRGTPTLNNLDSLDNKDSVFNDDDYYSDYFNENNKNNTDNLDNIDNIDNININKETEKLPQCQNPNNFTFGNGINNENQIKVKISGNFEDNISNLNNSKSLKTNLSKKFINIGHYDFKYLFKNNIVKRLFNQNNDKLNPMNFFTDEVYIMSNNNFLKKHKAILIISNIFFYVLKSNPQMEVVSALRISILENITISSRNCNLIHFTFERGRDFIIETLRRYEILKFLKDKIKEKGLKINIAHNFVIKKRNGESEIVNLKKLFSYTPNFENAIKIGILYKYQENFFTAKFHEKLVVLCSIGLMYFEENEKSPKAIIPIIGTSIRASTISGGAEKFYCFQLKTINSDNYIFGSKIKKEMLDWLHEFSLVQKTYIIKIKEIAPNLIAQQKDKGHKRKAS